MDRIEQVLSEAIDTGEVVKVKYNGGSQPGLIRELSPITINGDDVRARCLATNRVKTFKLSKMEISSADTASSYEPGKTLPEPSNLNEALEPHKESIEEQGWILVIEENEAGVYRTFKNGKLRKTPDVFIQYHELQYEYTDSDKDGNQIDIMKPSVRPWYVSHKRKQASSFKRLSSGIEKFLENVTEEAEHISLIVSQ